MVHAAHRINRGGPKMAGPPFSNTLDEGRRPSSIDAIDASSNRDDETGFQVYTVTTFSCVLSTGNKWPFLTSSLLASARARAAKAQSSSVSKQCWCLGERTIAGQYAKPVQRIKGRTHVHHISVLVRARQHRLSPQNATANEQDYL